MYKICLDGAVIYHPNIAAEYPIENAKLDIELNKTGSFKFVIRKNNPCYGSIKKMKSVISVYDNGRRIFRGRACSTCKGFHNEKTIKCEGELAFLLDTKVRPYSFQGSVADYFAFLVEKHNENVKDEWKKFIVGKCTVTDSNDYITRANTGYPKTLDEIKDKLVKILGGYLWTREESDGVYIDYLADFEDVNEQKVKFGENLLDFEEVLKANDMATVIIPLGCKLTDEEGNETGERLTIADVNGGLDYIYDEAAVETYGWIEAKVEFDDVTKPENLLTKGQAKLEEMAKLVQTIDLSAVDLHALKLSAGRFRLGAYTIVESPPHDFNERFLTRKLSIDLLNPSNSDLSLGAEKKVFTDKHAQTNQNINRVEKIANTAQINAGNVQNQVDSLVERVVINETNISQNSEEITALASRTEGNEQSIALLEVTADGLTTEVSAVKDGLTAAETSIKQNANEITQKVSKGSVSTEISQESDEVSIKGGRLVVESENFTLDKYGNMTASNAKFSGEISGSSIKSTEGDNWSIDDQGNMSGQNLSIEEAVNTDTLYCNDIANAAYPKTLTSTVTLYVNADTGDDSSVCETGAVFQTLQGAINSLPKFLNGRTVYIELQTDTQENVRMTYFSNGRIYIYLAGHTIYGYVYLFGAKFVSIYGGSKDGGGTDMRGTIHPANGYITSSYTCSVCYADSDGQLYNVDVYGADNLGTTSGKVSVQVTTYAHLYVSSVGIVNTDVGFKSNSGAHMHVASSSGIASKNGFWALSGGKISIGNASQSGGVSADTADSGGGEIKMHSPTFAEGVATTSGTTASTDTVERTVTYTSSRGNAIQHYGASNARWRSDSTPKVGDYGYGDHVAFWFFADSFEGIADKTITKAEITITRNSGGYGSAVQHNFYTHGYELQPGSVTPAYNATCIGSASVATGNSATITITDSSLLALIKAAKGICSIPPEQSKAYYSVLSGTMKIKFTYNE